MARFRAGIAAVMVVLALAAGSFAAEIRSAGQPAQLDIRAAGAHSVRITLKPLSFQKEFPYSPSLVDRKWAAPAISLRSIDAPVMKRVGGLRVTVRPNPLTVVVTDAAGKPITDLIFEPESGNVTFNQGDSPILGMGEGGPLMDPKTWRDQPLQFDRRGRLDEMIPRWQSQAYGSRNPVALLIGTEGWGLFISTPWVQVDLSRKDRGVFIPWKPPVPGKSQTAQIQGRPPVDGIVPGLFDLFAFDAHDPAVFMKEVSILSGAAVLPPRWSLGYMQSHRTLEDENQMINIVDTFRQKKIPLDSVVYLGTGFCPRGWNTKQPSFTFNPEVFKRDPKATLADLHERNVKTIVHIVPWGRDEGLPTLQGNIPPRAGEPMDGTHILNYWKQHVALFDAGVDAFWPDEGDWFNLFERMTRHQLYYQGPLTTHPNTRPWSLHRNGFLGVARWGGWIWSGDTDSSWRTLEAQIMVGQNHSLSVTPYWGSDTGGFYPNAELTGELFARWFQFSAFTPSFRSHGRTWWTRLPWGWGLNELGPLENGKNNPLITELNNPAIEPVCRKYSELRYQLLPYIYTLAYEANTTGMPLMRAMWLHYPGDARAVENGHQYLWGRDLLVAPVYQKGAQTRDVYLPGGDWYDWWNNQKEAGGRTVTRQVDLGTMPIYVRAGAIIPFDPVRQYTSQPVDGPTTLKVYSGADGQFTLYEDDGITLDYIQGKATWTRVTWRNASRQLTIEPGTPANVKTATSSAARTFRIQLLPSGVTKDVTYKGARLTVNLQ